jgi:uncharacterized protein (TIGR03067 family)
MTPRTVAFSFLVTLALTAGHSAGQDGKKLAELEGTWTIVKMQLHDHSLLEQGETWKLVIKDGKLSTDYGNAGKEAVALSKILDPSKQPRTITLPSERGFSFYGIYEVKGDELRVCGDGVHKDTKENPESRRPKEFSTKTGTFRLFFVFKREKN